ncbi:MAG: PD-(D/E)XK nuclease family protein [candidate division WOR-3 bacterium]|nr:PD-(D/E)XK nuclease family protein [candidate division WOR-3 bacterium]
MPARLLAALIAQAETCVALGYAGDPEDQDYRLASKFVELVRQQGGFTVETLPASPTPPEPQLFAFPTIEDEVAGICRDILGRGADVSLTDTVVAFPKLADYAAMVKRVFEQYELPVTVYPATDLAASPPVLAVLELLRALDSGYERIATAAALGSPFLPGLLKLKAESDLESRGRAAVALNHYSRRARIIKGRVNWNNIAARLEAAEDRLEDTEVEFVKDLQRRVRQATGLVEKMLEPADTIGNQARRLKQFLEAVDYCRNLKAEEPGTDELLEDRSALHDILDALTGFEDDFGARKESRAQFIKTLVYLIRLAGRAPEPAPAGVIVMDMTETLGLAPKHLYFGGLTEINLPGAYSGDPILPDRVRRELGMPDIDWHRDWQRFNFCRTLSASPNAPFLSFYDSDEGRPVLPSPFLTTTALKSESSDVIYSKAEEQTAQGKAAGVRFAATCRTVDFGRDADVLKTLAARFGPERPISVTRLEAYRTCPYLFYIESILGLETPEEPRYDIDARQWGLVVHRVMEKLYAHGSVPVEQVHDAAMKALDATLSEVELPVFWQEVTRKVFANLLPDLVRCEAELREGGFQPQKTELSLNGNLAKDIAVRGRFDRVDASTTAFRVLDYKTGRPGNFTPKAVIDGTHVQLPLYAWLYQQDKPGLAIDNFGVYALREPDVIWFARRKYTVDELVKAALTNAVAIVKSIRKGEFPALPADDRVCEYCNLGHTCGFTEAGKD